VVFDQETSTPVKQTPNPAAFGDSNNVTETGARQLGKRKMELITLGA
jgi:hypothetical protein